MTRLVLDASVLLSGVVSPPSSPPARLLMAARTDAFIVITCPLLVQEFRRGLAKPYFAGRVSSHEASRILDAYVLAATVFEDPREPPRVVRDPADDYLVALAKDSGADAIVTGDHDLTDHAELEPPAVDARTACMRLGLLPD